VVLQFSTRIASSEQLTTYKTLSHHKTEYSDIEPDKILSDPTGLVWDSWGQSGVIGTYAVPVNWDSHRWYSLLWPIDSELVSVKFHAHQQSHQQTLWFAGMLPHELGLTNDPNELIARDLSGNRSNAEVAATALGLAEPNDALVCTATGKQMLVDDKHDKYYPGYHTQTHPNSACFDRAPYPVCYQKQWKAREPYTVLVMNGPTDTCGHANPYGRQAYEFDTMPEHSTWFIYHTATGAETEASAYTVFAAMGMSTGDAYDSRSGWQLVGRDYVLEKTTQFMGKAQYLVSKAKSLFGFGVQVGPPHSPQKRGE